MRTDHQTMLEAFDEAGGRGDVLSLPKEDLVRLKAVPFERVAPIFYQLFKWFLDGDETPLDDPMANAMLEGMKEHQRQNALRRRAYLVRQANLSRKGVEARQQKSNANPRITQGQPVGNPRITQVKAKAEVKEEAKADSSFTSGGDGASRVDTAPPTPFSEADAKKFLAMNAPQISTLPGMLNQKGRPTMQCMKFIQDEINDVICAVGNRIHGRDPEDCDHPSLATFDDPLISIAERMEAAGKACEFRRTLVKALLDSDSDEVDNPAAFIMSRCKRCEEAVKALAGRRKASSGGSRG